MSDEEALRQLGDAIIDAFNRGDAVAYAAGYAPDADNLDSFGRFTKGRDNIEKMIAELFAGPYRGARITNNTEHIRVLTATSAISDFTNEIALPDAAPRKLAGISVAMKHDGKWSLVALRSWLAPPS
jgi:uncharacterized protein (TIGR02246 family)